MERKRETETKRQENKWKEKRKTLQYGYVPRILGRNRHLRIDYF